MIFAHGSGSSRFSPRNRAVAAHLSRTGFATLLFDLLTEGEAGDRANVFNIDLLASRLLAAPRWARLRRSTMLPVGLSAPRQVPPRRSARRPLREGIAAVVSRGGRPDLAGAALRQVKAPTLLIVGGEDREVLELNRRAARRLAGPHQFAVVPGAGHLFEEPGTLEQAARLAVDVVRALRRGAFVAPPCRDRRAAVMTHDHVDQALARPSARPLTGAADDHDGCSS